MIHPGKGPNTVRAVFVVDPKSVVRLMIYYPQEVGRNIDEVLRALEALQTADKWSVAMPANWPQNELIGRKVLIPPPSDEKTPKERAKMPDKYDWWFCFKDLQS